MVRCNKWEQWQFDEELKGAGEEGKDEDYEEEELVERRIGPGR